MPPTVITELRLGPEQREIHQVLDVKGATSALPEDAEPERPALPPRPALTQRSTIKGSVSGRSSLR
ncbi:MAG TPA: hypothetical protein VK942_11945 [Actinomycetes bacterium]|nr:hypothetical protein [Actinomycetes bacterium]